VSKINNREALSYMWRFVCNFLKKKSEKSIAVNYKFSKFEVENPENKRFLIWKSSEMPINKGKVNVRGYKIGGGN
jgi:hypothetical protein